GYKHRALFAFGLSVTLEVLNESYTISDQQATMIVSHILFGLQSKDYDCWLASLTIYILLCTKYQVSRKLHIEVFRSAGQFEFETRNGMSHMMLSLLCAYKNQANKPVQFPADSIRHLLQHS